MPRPSPLTRALTVGTVALAVLVLGACSASSLPTEPASLGTPSTRDAAIARSAEPGPITLTKYVAAHWNVPLSGLVNLDHPAARAAGLEDRAEAIDLYVFVLEHPVHGTWLVDAGIAESFRDPGSHPDIAWLVRKAMGTANLEVVTSNRQLLAGLDTPVAGVLLTHIHIDHILGLADLPEGTPVYLGPGDVDQHAATHLATRGSTDRLLAHAGALHTWRFGDSGVLDVFGDGSLFAIHAPGHTAGSTVYLARTTSGPQLLIGDVTHTRWGWEHGVEPGTYSIDPARSAAALRDMQALAAAIPGVQVHPGHQSLP